MTTRKYNLRLLLFAVSAALAVVVVGCGGSGSSSSGGSETSEPSTGKPFKGSPEIVKFGKPAPASDAEAASKVLAENLEARESGDFAGQCASLTVVAQGEIVGAASKAKAKECPKKLEELAMPLSGTAALRVNTFDGTIDELRMEGQKAWALYHGNNSKNYAIPLQLEGGAWKVAAIVTTELG